MLALDDGAIVLAATDPTSRSSSNASRQLDADCGTLETMRLVDGVCRFAELATAVEA